MEERYENGSENEGTWQKRYINNRTITATTIE